MSKYLGMLVHPTNGNDDVTAGVHLRWASHYKLGFPIGGYRLYRRKSIDSNFHCLNPFQLKIITSISEYPIDITLPDNHTSSHITIQYSSSIKNFEVLALNGEELHWKRAFTQGKGTIDILSGEINRVVFTEKVKITRLCYWLCSGDGWESINDRCGLGLPSDVPIDEALRKKLIARSKDPCDPYWGMALCRLDNMGCNFKGQNFQDLKDMISKMAGEGQEIPVGWNEFSSKEDISSSTEEDSPTIGISPYDMLLIQSVNPDIAKMLGLYWIDKKAEAGKDYDYKIEADWDDKAVLKLEHEFTFDEEETGKPYFPLFHKAIKKSNLLFLGEKPRILEANSILARVKNGLAFDYPEYQNESTIRIIFDEPVKEVQLFIQQKGLKTELEAHRSWPFGLIDTKVLRQREGVLSVYGESIKHLVLKGQGIVILRLHYDFEELKRGRHSFCICGVRKHPEEDIEAPKELSAICLRGAVTEVDDNCNETEYRFRAGLRWDYPGDLNTGILTSGPIGYYLKRWDERGNELLLNDGEPIFIIPETPAEEEGRQGLQRPLDCEGKPLEERQFYNDAVVERGVYKYRVRSFDIFGRRSNESQEVEIELKPSAPPPPINVRAKFLDWASYDDTEDTFKDPTLIADEKEWLKENEVNGFLIKWSWPENLQKQAADAMGFRIRFFTGWLNVYQGTIKDLDKIGDNEYQVTFDFADTHPPLEESLENEWIKIRGLTYEITAVPHGDIIYYTVKGIAEKMILPEDRTKLQLKNGDAFLLSVSIPKQQGGKAINYDAPENWPLFFHEELIEVPTTDEYSLTIPLPPALDFPNYSKGKTLYGQIAINTFLKDGVEDIEGSMSTPATVMAVKRYTLAAPTIDYPTGDSLLATPSDFYGKSTFEVSLPVGGDDLRYDVYRCMDEKLFLQDRQNRDTRGAALYQEIIEHITVDLAKFSATEVDYASLVEGGKYNLLRAIASLPDNQEAFGKLNDKPLKGISSYLDESLDGRGDNLYFYKVRPVDEIGNQGEFSLATPPVEIPKVTPPVAPVITKIVGGQKQIIVKWSGNPGAGIVGYLVYRTDDKLNVGNWRKMELLKVNDSDEYSVVVTDVLPENNQYEYVDESVEAKVKYYYSVVAISLEQNGQQLKSKMSIVKMSQSYDDSVPEPPEWVSTQETLDAGPRLLKWSSLEIDLTCLVQRRLSQFTSSDFADEFFEWAIISQWLPKGVYEFEDLTAIAGEIYEYRIKVKDSTGLVNREYNILEVVIND